MNKVDYTNPDYKPRTGKENNLKGAAQILVGVGLAAGLYGFNLGRASGYNKGVKDGYQKATDEFIEVMKGLTEEIRASRISE